MAPKRANIHQRDSFQKVILIGKKRELAANKISDLITTSVQTRMKAPLPIGEPVNHPEASMHPFDHVVRANATPTLGREFVQQVDGISTPSRASRPPPCASIPFRR